MKKIIFLDIDGVLWTGNHDRHVSNHEEDPHSKINEFCPKAVTQLNRILSTDNSINIVISSSWRCYRSLEWFKDHFKAQGIDPNRIIGCTPYLSTIRGLEIKQWLDTQSIKSDYWVSGFVILDDDEDMGDLSDHLVKTSFYPGLTESKASKAIEILNTPYGSEQ